MQDREYIKRFVDNYIRALEKRDFSALPVSDVYKYSENCELIRLGQGIISYPVKETIRLEIYDVKTGQAAVQSVLDNGEKLIMFFLRLKIKDDKIIEIETLVNPGDKGVPIPFDPANITEISDHWKRSIRPAERDSRFKLMDVADGYWRAMETEHTRYLRNIAINCIHLDSPHIRFSSFSNAFAVFCFATREEVRNVEKKKIRNLSP